MRLTLFKDAEGHRIAIDADYVALITPAMMPDPNTLKGKILALGKVMIVLHNGTQVVVDGTMETVYGKLRKGEESILEV